MTVEQFDSICKADTVPGLSSWDSLYVGNTGYIYLYRDSSRTYRIYRVNDSILNITKRIDR